MATLSAKIETRLFINNEYVPAIGGETFDLKNPHNEEFLCSVSSAQKADVDAAVDAANAAFPAWSKLPVFERTKPFRKLAELMKRDADQLAYLEGAAMGMPKSLYMSSLLRCYDCIDWVCSVATTQLGETSHNHYPNMLALKLHQPFGPCAGIIPWNVSIVLFFLKTVPCVSAGNTMVLKPSEKSPLSVLRLGQLVKEAGFPPGVINIVPGFGHVAGAALASHPLIRKISFTGSVGTGRAITKAAAESNGKRVQLEQGGKGPSIICPSADIDVAAKQCAISIARNSGQICQANTRVYCHASVFDEFLEKYCANFEKEVVHGDPQNQETTQGPLADKVQFDRVMAFLEKGKTEGKVRMGGGRARDKGYYVEPTVFVSMAEDASLNKEEIFGPVTIVHKWTTEEDVMRRANDTEYGLTASVYTRDVSQSMRMAQQLESGQVMINAAHAMQIMMPFSGWKSSGGTGREGGSTAISEWTQSKVVYVVVDPTPLS